MISQNTGLHQTHSIYLVQGGPINSTMKRRLLIMVFDIWELFKDKMRIKKMLHDVANFKNRSYPPLRILKYDKEIII